LLGRDHHPRDCLDSEEHVLSKQLAASQQRRSQGLQQCHAIARQIHTCRCQQDVRLIERNGRSLCKSRRRRGQLKTSLANSKRIALNKRSENLNPHKHWILYTMSLHLLLSLSNIHGPAAHPPRPGPHPGTWVCCLCRQTNDPRTCPSVCPVDGHHKCSGCYVYPRALKVVNNGAWPSFGFHG
jgi:hypothetical protein